MPLPSPETDHRSELYQAISCRLGGLLSYLNVYRDVILAVFKDTFVPSLSRKEQKYREKRLEDLALF